MKDKATLKRQPAFDFGYYLDLQVKAIRKRAESRKADRFYIEFGGKIFDDMHASRVLPGYFPDTKLRIIKEIFEHAEVIFVISAKDIVRKRIRGDHKITYDREVFRLLSEFKKKGITINNIFITMMPRDKSSPSAMKKFISDLLRIGKKVKFLREDFNHINPKKDWAKYKRNDFFNISKKYVVVLSPGGGSGKFGVCINQLFHEMSTGHKPFYIKFETFPVHDLSVLHPLNLAYMAASVDFYDLVMKDPRDKRASSYNRDIENYELLHSLSKHFPKEGTLLKHINSATNMGVNVVSKAIRNWEEVEKESAAEVGRRLIRHRYEVRRGEEKAKVLKRMRKIVSIL